MSKNIVVCSDGTGSSSIKGRGTNVFKIYEAVDLHGHFEDASLLPQIAVYDDGVGTDRLKTLKALGGAFGWGLSRNVKQLYTAIAREYKPGDKIYLFGFSRGAFTVRTLAGFLTKCGIIDISKCESDKELQRLVEIAYKCYRYSYSSLIGDFFRFFAGEKNVDQFRSDHAVDHKDHAPGGRPFIEFIGVWDTVDAVGLPFDHAADIINLVLYRFKFMDYKLNKHVRKACHAMSIDDERQTFHPVMWDEKDDNDNRIEQVWFSGVHTNVGGGYPKQGMSLVSLEWMMGKARAAGLRFIGHDENFFSERKNINDKLYDSRAGFAIYYRYKPRDIGRYCRQYGLEPKIHISTFDRIMQDSDGYAPGNIPRESDIFSTGTSPFPMEQISTKIDEALGEDASLLDRTRYLILLRRSSHYAFLFFSALAVYFTYTSLMSQSGEAGMSALFNSGNLLKELVSTLLLRPWILCTIVFFYGFGVLLRRTMEKRYSTFWFRLLPDLKEIMNKPNAT